MKAIVIPSYKGGFRGLLLGGNRKLLTLQKIFSIVRKPTSGNLFAILFGKKALTHANIRKIKITIG
jgi:hypothetical protein